MYTYLSHYFTGRFCHTTLSTPSISITPPISVGANPVISIDVTTSIQATDIRVSLKGTLFKIVQIRPSSITIKNETSLYDSRVSVAYEVLRANTNVRVKVTFVSIRKADDGFAIKFEDTADVDEKIYTLFPKYCNNTFFEPTATSLVPSTTCGYGCKKQFTCNATFKAVNFTALCQDNASWNVTTTPCSKPCNNLFFTRAKAVDNSIVSNGETKEFGCKCTKPVPSFTRTCGSDGQWTNGNDPCSSDCNANSISCFSPMSAGLFCGGEKHRFNCPGDTACEPRTFELECLPNGTWAETTCNCGTACDAEDIKCGSPASKGLLCSGKKHQFNCTGDLVCEQNFERECQTGGTWTNITCSCQKDCNGSFFEPNATIRKQSDTCGFGREQIFHCNHPFEPLSFTARCLSNTKWNITEALCATCDNSFFSDAVAVDSGIVRNGESKEFRCTCTQPVANFTRTCGSDGRWSDQTNPCSSVCSSNRISCGSPVSAGLLCGGERHLFNCPGDNACEPRIFELECLANGTWVEIDCNCGTDCSADGIHCGSPVGEGPLCSGEKHQFICNGDLVCEPKTFELECQANGSWADTTCSCQKDCDGSFFQPNATIKNHSNTCGYGREQIFHCNHPIERLSFTAQCLDNAKWNITDAPCDTCDNSFFTNAVAVDNTVVGMGESKEFTCKCTQPVASFIRTCDSDGRWSNQTQPCSSGCNANSIPCGTPVSDGLLCGGEKHKFNCLGNTTCDPKIFELECRSNGTWADTTCNCGTVCDAGNITCGSPVGNGLLCSGKKHQFYCNRDLVCEPTTFELECQANGNWVNTTCNCGKATCSESSIQSICGKNCDYGNVTAVWCGETLNYTCTNGAVIAGITDVYCDATGSFNVSEMVCRSPDCPSCGSIGLGGGAIAGIVIGVVAARVIPGLFTSWG